MGGFVKVLSVLLLLGGGGYAAYVYGTDYFALRTQRNFREVEVTKGQIVSIVTATGTIRPTVTVQVGAFVSGQIKEIHVDFNDEVSEGQLLAQIDPRTYESYVARDNATLVTAKAEQRRMNALLEQARNEEQRALSVKAANPDFVSDVELDNVKYQRMSLEAQVEVAAANVTQAEAMLSNSQANLEFTQIRAPVSGIVINREIEPGQTLASQFQVPRLFEIAQGMDQEMRITASIDESDIGTIMEASKRKTPVRFTVDAYPGETFEGTIIQIRSSSISRESIVTYPVIISIPNPDPRLLPGMTANLEFETSVIDDTLRIPNTALRFFPEKDQIDPAYRAEHAGAQGGGRSLSGMANVPSRREDVPERHTRVVWVKTGNFVRPVEVELGDSNHSYTQVLQGDLKAGDLLVDAVLVN